MANGATPERPRILVLGRPGSGKGTQCARIAARFGIPHISTGDLFRATVARDTPLGRVVRAYMDAGDLVPDDLVLDVVADRLGPDGAALGFVLDGFPRSIPQAEQLADLLDPFALDLALDLVVPADVARLRLTTRLVCGDCGRSVGGGAIGACGDCGGSVEARADDDASTVARRLAVYDRTTAPLSDWLDRRELLIRIDGIGRPAEVAARIDAACDVLLVSGSEDLAS
ncbi:MAG: nucleoside monophosphate kinase [Actinobacteria bacterium]|nr:nucleoside monophosphate kinase [Actinomycetota bacterium]